MRMIRLSLAIMVMVAATATAQTSQATLAGVVRDAQGAMIAGARIAATHDDTGRVITAVSNASGAYTLPFLPLGRYIVRAQARGFRPLMRTDIDLHVAQLETADFQLEPLPPGATPQEEANGVGLIYGADAQKQLGVIDARPPQMTDATSTTVSGVIDDARVHELPLNGRDIYTLFVLMPGVTSDNATQRGLGFSVNGFPVSSSNYLLDGLDNNNVRTTYPVTLLSPDGIEEYRLATANFSAEYGRGAFVANVVTKSGGNHWHAQLFEFLINDKLSAEGFQDNAAGRAKTPFKENQFGYAAGGPIKRDRIFVFTSIEALEAGTRGVPKPVILPSASFIAHVAGPIAKDLFARFPERGLANVSQLDANRISGLLAEPIPFSSLAASGRLDFDLRPDRDSLFVRFGSFHQSQTAIVSPYAGLETPFVIANESLGGGWIHRFGSSRVNEAKLGVTRNLNQQVPAVAGVGQFQSNDLTSLPGIPDSSTEQSYTDTLLHGVENFSLLLARHHIVAGGDFQSVWNRSLVGPQRIGNFGFANVQGFGADTPTYLDTTVSRFSPTVPTAPDYTRASHHSEFSLFVQDNWRVTSRLTLNLGLRHESFGTPGADVNFQLGAGNSPLQRIAAGSLTSQRVPFQRDGNNFAPRFGMAFDLFGTSKTILRTGYGVYYDRVFQQVYQSLQQNSYVEQFFLASDTPFKYMSPAGLGLPASMPALSPARASYIDPALRTPYVQTWFAGVQQALGRNTLIEINHTGSLGRKLITSDLWNRELGNSQVLFINATANQGKSDSASLQTSVQRRFSGGLEFQASWTWSHSIDNQGDPLLAPVGSIRAFQREFDSNGDRGNSDFDQRHNVIFNWIWRTPRAWASPLRDWQVAGIAGYRTGFPLTVFSDYLGSTIAGDLLVLPRASLISPNYAIKTPADGGETILNLASFKAAPGAANTTRGEFRGPGFWNYDASLSREFPLRHFGESSRLQFRAEVFNLFNHANLGNPDTRLLDGPFFGNAGFGREGVTSTSVGTAPLNDSPRRVQLVLRINF